MQRLDAPYVGCFREPVGGTVQERLMTILAEDDTLTIDKCIGMARDRGFTFAAVQSNTQVLFEQLYNRVLLWYCSAFDAFSSLCTAATDNTAHVCASAVK
jgi:hypothetical protein